MKDTVRVSFDVPLNDHTFLKAACVHAHIPFRSLMQVVFHKTVEEFKKKQLHEKMRSRIANAYKTKGREITKDYLDQIEKEIGNLDV